MATVSEKSYGRTPDRPYMSPNRFVTATPIASLTPQYRGEIVQWYDSVTGLTYQFKAVGVANTSWVRADYEVKVA